MPLETFFESYKFFLTEYSDLFLTMGQNLFKGLATILIVWFGIKAALSSAEDGEGFAFSKFATLVLMISFNYFMVYNYPSFYGLVTDQADDIRNKIVIDRVQLKVAGIPQGVAALADARATDRRLQCQ